MDTPKLWVEKGRSAILRTNKCFCLLASWQQAITVFKPRKAVSVRRESLPMIWMWDSFLKNSRQRMIIPSKLTQANARKWPLPTSALRRPLLAIRATTWECSVTMFLDASRASFEIDHRRQTLLFEWLREKLKTRLILLNCFIVSSKSLAAFTIRNIQ